MEKTEAMPLGLESCQSSVNDNQIPIYNSGWDFEELKKKIAENLNGLPFGLEPMQAAELCGFDPKLGYKLIREHGLPAFRIGRRFCVPTHLFLEWVEKRANEHYNVNKP